LTHSEIAASSNNVVNTLIAIPYQANVLVEKTTENINVVNVSTDDLVINYIYWFYVNKLIFFAFVDNCYMQGDFLSMLILFLWLNYAYIYKFRFLEFLNTLEV